MISSEKINGEYVIRAVLEWSFVDKENFNGVLLDLVEANSLYEKKAV